MNLNTLQQTEELAIKPLIAIVAQIRVVFAQIPVNPPEIVTIEDSGFEVNMNKMNPFEPCMVDFQGSRHLIWKNSDGALVETVMG